MNVTKNKVHILLTVADLPLYKISTLRFTFFVFKKIEYSSFYNRIKNYQGFCTQNSEKYTI